MDNKSVIPWHQYTMIAYLALQLGKGGKLGKTAMQKLIYLIQALEGVPVGYSFHFYHYGPYSSDLAGDLEFVDTLQGIRITYDPYINMYNISAGDKAHLIIKKAEDFLEQYKGKIDRVISIFGNKRAEDLELIASIVYTGRMAQVYDDDGERSLVKRVAELKPKFSIQEIEHALNDLKTRGYLADS
jgi:uncharacterized protein YwgA